MTIVLYFSRSGENLIEGQIQPLSKGNTQLLAEKISQKLNVPIFEITPILAYPYSYKETVKLVEQEKIAGVYSKFQKIECDLDSVEQIF